MSPSPSLNESHTLKRGEDADDVSHSRRTVCASSTHGINCCGELHHRQKLAQILEGMDISSKDLHDWRVRSDHPFQDGQTWTSFSAFESPSVSQTAAVTRPHLRVFPEWIMLRVPKIAPVFLLFIELEFGQEVRNAVGL